MLEAALEANTAALAAHTAALTKNSDYLARVIAGQEAALAKIEGGKPATTRAKKEEPKAEEPKDAPKTEEPKTEQPKAEEAAGRVVSDDDVRKAGAAMVDGKSKEDAAALFAKVREAIAWMGLPEGSKVSGPESKLDADQRKQIVFFMNRWQDGLPVNFSADYDFDGPIDQGCEADDANPFS